MFDQMTVIRTVYVVWTVRGRGSACEEYVFPPYVFVYHKTTGRSPAHTPSSDNEAQQHFHEQPAKQYKTNSLSPCDTGEGESFPTEDVYVGYHCGLFCKVWMEFYCHAAFPGIPLSEHPHNVQLLDRNTLQNIAQASVAFEGWMLFHPPYLAAIPGASWRHSFRPWITSIRKEFRGAACSTTRSCCCESATPFWFIRASAPPFACAACFRYSQCMVLYESSAQNGNRRNKPAQVDPLDAMHIPRAD